MVSTRASGSADVSQRQPESTHEVFCWTRRCDLAAQNTPEIAKLSHFTRENLVRWHLWKSACTKRLLFSRRMLLCILRTYPKHLRKKTLRPLEGLYVIGPEKGLTRAKSSRIMYISTNCSETRTYGSCLKTPHSTFKSYVYVAQTSTRVSLTTFFPEWSSVSLKLLPWNFCREICPIVYNSYMWHTWRDRKILSTHFAGYVRLTVHMQTFGKKRIFHWCDTSPHVKRK